MMGISSKRNYKAAQKIQGVAFKKLVQSRFGSHRGYLAAACEALDMNYQTLSHTLAGRTPPKQEHIDALTKMPQKQEVDFKHVPVPRTLTTRLNDIQEAFNYPTYGDALLKCLEAGILIAEGKIEEHKNKNPRPHPENPDTANAEAFE